jgi:hypothetical protein
MYFLLSVLSPSFAIWQVSVAFYRHMLLFFSTIPTLSCQGSQSIQATLCTQNTGTTNIKTTGPFVLVILLIVPFPGDLQVIALSNTVLLLLLRNHPILKFVHLHRRTLTSLVNLRHLAYCFQIIAMLKFLACY